MILEIDRVESGTEEITNDVFGSNKIEITPQVLQDAGLGDCTLTLERSYNKEFCRSKHSIRWKNGILLFRDCLKLFLEFITVVFCQIKAFLRHIAIVM